MKNPTIIRDWLAAQGSDFPHTMDEPVQLGPIYSDSWKRDPKHLLFALARYKFVSKMLAGEKLVAEVGAGDGFGSELVRKEVEDLWLFDLSPLAPHIHKHDIMEKPPDGFYNAIYALDVLEHINNNGVFFSNLIRALKENGKLIIGTPSLEGQEYASEPSRKLHINCMFGETLRTHCKTWFHHVFMFSMNDEVVHTGFMPMAHYLFAVCAEPRR